MASKYEISNESPAILNSIDKKSRTFAAHFRTDEQQHFSELQQRPSYRLFFNDKPLSKYALKRQQKLAANLIANTNDKRQTLSSENSLFKLRQKLKLRHNVPSYNGGSPKKFIYLEDTEQKTHSGEKNVQQKVKSHFKSLKSKEAQYSLLDSGVPWNIPSEKSLNTRRASILEENSGKDHVDVLLLRGASTEFSSGIAIGLVAIFLVVAFLIYWIKNAIFNLVKQKSTKQIATKKIENYGFLISNKRNLLVLHKTLRQQPQIITRHTAAHLTKIMNIDASGEPMDRSIGSNKSTPYFTPLGTMDEGCSRFEFPLPSPPHTSLCSNEDLLLPISPALNTKSLNTNGSRVCPTKNASFDSIQSPTRRLRRCSLYERRSCSPQRTHISNLVSNRSSCKSHIENYEQLFSSPIHSAISAIALNSSPTAVDSGRQFSFNRQNCCSPKVYENRTANLDCDKENEIPIGGEVYSPKLKTSDIVLLQQNSPRILEASPTFSFSPNIIDRAEIFSNHATIKSSPSLCSAGYKNGNYFKFPEVDCFSPDGCKLRSAVNFTRDDAQSNNLQDKLKVANSAVDCQASRRARLKSISLDSEGAKLVEDNLGVPVEELIERAGPVASDFFTKNIMHTPQSGLKQYTKNDNLECSALKSKFNQIQIKSDYNNKNKNNLTISIENVNDVNTIQKQNKQDAPKTPTLVQTIQKAISLDSSDSKFSTSKRCVEERHDGIPGGTNTDYRPLGVSLLHISSLSMPGTPKRQLAVHKNANHLNRSKLASPMSGGTQIKSKGRHFSLTKSPTSSTPSTSSFDHSKSTERQGFILKLDSFNENTMDDADYDKEEAGADEEDGDNYFLNIDEVAVVNEENFSENDDNTINASFGEDSRLSVANMKKLSPDYLLGSSLQTQKCTTLLSLSNSNLKTLPEVMTLSDFTTRSRDNEINLEKDSTAATTTAAGHTVAKQANLPSGRSVRSSLLQRRGSNHSLTLNLNGSYGSLSKGLSTSNYSLGSNSQYNLSNSIYNLSHNQPGSFKTCQSLFLKGNPVGISAFIQNSNAVGGAVSSHVNANICTGGSTVEKKNLLQRRGSNTSLTLNIHGSPCVNLNRFNSHSSLNIPSQQQQQKAFKIQHHIKDSTNENTDPLPKSKRGLLERRGSNTSLSINLQSNALAVSNINLRGSACSLSSINTNQLEEEYDSQQHHPQENAYVINMNNAGNNSGRKFFSSENLNNLNCMTQYSRLNQAHVRSSTKTCFGSVSDLKPYCQLPLSLIIGEEKEIHFKNQEVDEICLNLPKTKDTNLSEKCMPNFKQSNLCSCTGVRNISTRPLSPQTTSEDFKIYLANVQLLQNASNILNEYDLMKLNYMFDKSYGNEDDASTSAAAEENHPTKTEELEEDKWKLVLRSDIQFELPVEDEQKRLLRNLHQEFWDLPTNHQEKPMVFGSQTKNRYKSILPNEHSRVLLVPEEGNLEASYINANYIKGPDYVQKRYIATQGPLPNTIYDFWLMVFQNIRKYDEQKPTQSTKPTTPPAASSTSKLHTFPRLELEHNHHQCHFSSNKLKSAQQKIVMLTNFVENNRQKCSAYFPIDEDELFLITYSNDQVKHPEIDTFYNQYFDNVTNKQSPLSIETFRIEIKNKQLIHHLPKANYFIIKNTGIITKNGFSIRQLNCLFCCNINNSKNTLDETINEVNGNLNNEKRIQLLHRFTCYHYWYPDWPDHRSPSDISVLLEISQHLLALENSHDQPLPIIHCSAGIGRTGCMAAILNAICQIRASISSSVPLSPITSLSSTSSSTCSKQMMTTTANASASGAAAVAHENTNPTTIPLTTSRLIAIAKNSNIFNSVGSDGNTSEVDNLQSFPSQSFPYSNLNSSGKIIKNSKAPSEDICGYIVEVKKNKDAGSIFHDWSKNNMYCESIKKSPSIYVDILGIVCNLRLQRGGMVQNSEQYELIHRAMCLYLKRVLKYIYERHAFKNI